jgi:hypothetical protein
VLLKVEDANDGCGNKAAEEAYSRLNPNFVKEHGRSLFVLDVIC